MRWAHVAHNGLLATPCRLLATRYRLLANRCWLLASRYRLLATRCRLLATPYRLTCGINTGIKASKLSEGAGVREHPWAWLVLKTSGPRQQTRFDRHRIYRFGRA